MGGGFQYSLAIWEALRALPAAKWDVQAVCLSPEWHEKIRREGGRSRLVPEQAAARAIRRVCKRLPGGTAAWRRLGPRLSGPMRAVAEFGADLAVFPCEPYLSLGTTCPALVPIHDLMYLYERRFPEVGAPAIFRNRHYVDRHVCRYARGILVDSMTGKRQVLESFGPAADRVFVLPYVAPDYLAAAGRTAPPPFDRYVFYPAQLWEHKNHAGLLRALARLRDQGMVVNAVFCGAEKNGGPRIRAEIERLGLGAQVALLGYVEAAAMGGLYAGAVALVMPTYFGPTNIPPLEAFARGCPVAISGIYGMHEQLGDAALFFDPGDDGQIAAAIARLWRDEDLRRNLVEKGRAWIRRWNQTTFNTRFAETVAACAS